MSERGAGELLEGLRRGTRRDIARAITALEDRTAAGAALADLLRGQEPTALVVGLTGPPGAGKSTLMSALTDALSEAHRVAVLLIDPSSPVTGGAVLGDRVRFSQRHASGNAYVRSLGNRGHRGGVTESTTDVVRALEAAGFDTVLIETVGSGQSDVAVTSSVDCTILVTPPGLGDEVQAIKAGILEVADILVVTKSDLPGAEQVSSQLRRVAKPLNREQPRPVVKVSSQTGEGVDQVVSLLKSRRGEARRRTGDVLAVTQGDLASSFELSGRVVLVTGASSGLGRRFARVLHAAGATVVVAARRHQRLQELKDELGQRILPVACDVTQEADRERLMGVVGDRLDVLVNNAGIGDVIAAEDEPVDQFRSVLELNLVALFAMSQCAARLMLARGSGSIINISSALGAVASSPISQAGYCASKGGVINLTRELAAQWAARGVRVNALAPGWFESEMTDDMLGTERGADFIRRGTPIRRAGRPDELDAALLLLAGDGSMYIAGQTLFVDGGWTVR